MSEYSRALGDTVRAARKKMGLSQNKVAALIDADERTIMNIEAYNANTTMDVLYPLIRILRIPQHKRKETGAHTWQKRKHPWSNLYT